MLKNILTAFLVIMLSSCGFRPLYSEQNDKLNLSAVVLRNIEYKEKIKSNISISFRKQLENILSRSIKTSNKKYYLDIALVTEIKGASIQANSIAVREDIICKIVYTLKEIGTEKIVFTDNLLQIENIDLEYSPFVNYVAEQETLNRMMRNISYEMTLRLHSWLERP